MTVQRNHFEIHSCTCGYSTYSEKWMKKHLRKKHNNPNQLFVYPMGEPE